MTSIFGVGVEPICYAGNFCGEIYGVVGEAESAGGDTERRLKQRLPDVEEGHQAAEAIGTVGFAQENVAAACLRHGGAEFGPDAAIERREDGADDPREDALRAAHGADDERNDDEGADADHERHIQGGGFDEAQTAFEFFGFGHFLCAREEGQHSKKGARGWPKTAGGWDNMVQ